MKTKSLLGTFMFICCMLSFTSCLNDNLEEEGTQVTGYEEYTLTVASKKLLGVDFSCGSDVVTEVYAVKKADADEWEPFTYIQDFDYEPGYEYTLRISETDYVDYRRGDPAWTEYKLLEVLSKEKKDSEGLPEHLIPETYNNKFSIHTSYAVEAEHKEQIENELNSHLPVPQNNTCIFYTNHTQWIWLDAGNHIVKQGTIERQHKDWTEFPDSYKLLPPERQVTDSMEWTFLSDENAYTFDTFIIRNGLYYQFAFYKDLTEHYRNKYPEAGVRTVVVAYTLIS